LRFFRDDAIVVDIDPKEVPSTAEGGQDRQMPATIEELSASVDRRFDIVDQRFESVDRRFDAIDQRFEAVDGAIIEQRQYTEFAFGKLHQELVVVKSGLGRVERKLDRLIDASAPSKEPDPD
jgi:hypothetical protein